MKGDCHIGGAPSLEMIGDVAAQSRRTATTIFGSNRTPRAAMPMSVPPPQSPVMSPSAREPTAATIRRRPTQLIPAPTTTATPQPSSAPARSIANVSLATELLEYDPDGRSPGARRVPLREDRRRP